MRVHVQKPLASTDSQDQKSNGSGHASRHWSSRVLSVVSKNRLLVSPFLFALCWWFLFVMHFFNGALALAFSAVYLYFSREALYPAVAVLKMPIQLVKMSGWAHLALGVVHWVALSRMVVRSIRKKQLSFAKPQARRSSSSSSSSSTPKTWLRIASNRLASCEKRLWAPWNRVFGIDGIFGVNGEYFHVAFFAREAIEVGLQTYQTSQLSGSVRRQWITALAVLTIAVNSLASPLIQLLMRKKSESANRFMSLLVDMSLDFFCAAVIPMCVVYPYIVGYDPSIGSFAPELYSEDTWFESSVSEIRQFCVTSVIDLFATMMPHITVFTGLNVAKKLVLRDSVRRVIPVPYWRRVSVAMVVTVKDGFGGNSKSSLTLLGADAKVRLSPCHFGMHCLFHALMIGWTIAVVAIHLQARSFAASSHVPGCRMTVDTWFVEQTPCTVMQINCHVQEIQGRSLEIAQALTPLARRTLKKLIITHCPALEIPPVLSEFDEVTEIELYNSTLLDWPMEAAATPATLRSLANFNWIASPYINFPAGLLHNNLPEGFTRLLIVKSNITELPGELGSLWANRYFDIFSLQSTQLSRLPSSFNELGIRKLRLIRNNLTSISDAALATKRLVGLHLSGNPLRSLPTSIGDTSQLVEFMAEYTELQTVSKQVAQWWESRPSAALAPYLFSLYGSPICETETQWEPCNVDFGNVNGTYLWKFMGPQRSHNL